MQRLIPSGWKRIDKYHMRNGETYIARAYVDGRMRWTLWVGKDIIGSAWDDEDGFAKMIARSNLSEKRRAA